MGLEWIILSTVNLYYKLDTIRSFTFTQIHLIHSKMVKISLFPIKCMPGLKVSLTKSFTEVTTDPNMKHTLSGPVNMFAICHS